jgi:hypothetical protein
MDQRIPVAVLVRLGGHKVLQQGGGAVQNSA